MLKTRSDQLLVVAAALIDRHGQVLVQQRPADKPHGGLWEFAGGKVEAGETPEAALVRELREELGVRVEQSELAPLAFASHPPLLLLLYVCRRWRGEPRALEATALAWLRPAAMADLPMPPADRPLVVALEQLVRLAPSRS